MSATKLEITVKANARKLDKVIFKLGGQSGQYVVFNGTKTLYASDFALAVEAGEKTFGKTSGFVVRKVGYKPSFSCVVLK